MERRPEFSIVIATYNAASTLGEQLDALLAQECADSVEVLVVDNRSTDDTVGLVGRYRERMPHLRLVTAPERQGKAYAANIGARAALGDYQIFIDADDVVAPGWLAAMIAALRGRHAVAGAIDAKTLNQSGPNRPFGYRGVEHKALGFLPYLIGCNMGLSREAYEAVGGYDESLPRSEDFDLSWRLQLKGYELHYAPDAVVRYRHRPSLDDLWDQIYGYAFYYPLLYKRFAAYGMPRSSARKVLDKYLWLIAHIYYLKRHDEGWKTKWLYEAAYAWGLVRGSLHYRVLYL
ncbi:MAG: glycosyltransferase [Chloroflexales bacterium]|nr:glycosyltransferase [Chloroflexales bacterium]